MVDLNLKKLLGNNAFTDIVDTSMEVLRSHKELGGLDIGDVPISPMVLDSDDIPIVISSKVYQEYAKYVVMINETKTAREYSFLLLGKKAKIGEEECYYVDTIINCTNYDALNDRITSIDNNKLNLEIMNALQNGYDFISLGHTHPKISDEEKEVSVVSHLSSQQINNNYLREVGLNLSLQDFISYDALYEYLINKNIRTSFTVIMFNGEMVMVSKKNGEVKRFVTIMNSNGEELYVSSKEEYQRKKSL